MMRAATYGITRLPEQKIPPLRETISNLTWEKRNR